MMHRYGEKQQIFEATRLESFVQMPVRKKQTEGFAHVMSRTCEWFLAG